jgi:hypothetical protein
VDSGPCQRCQPREEYRRAPSSLGPVLVNGGALDVPGAQPPAAVEHAAWYHAGVPDECSVLEDQGVHAAEHVLVGVVGDLAERRVEQAADGRPRRGVEVGGVDGPQLGHM